MPVKFNIGLAKQVISIIVQYESTYDFCKDYVTDKNSDFEITITESDIKCEYDKCKMKTNVSKNDLLLYTKPYLEILALNRKLAIKLIDYNTILLHGSAIALDNEGYIFVAKSGIGKSTHTKLWCDYFGTRAMMVNDDKPLLKIIDNSVFIYGSPWSGKEKKDNNISIPLKSIAFLNRDTDNHIEKIDKNIVFPLLYQYIFFPNDASRVKKAMELSDKIVRNVNFYQLYCNMNDDAVKVSYYGMNEK